MRQAKIMIFILLLGMNINQAAKADKIHTAAKKGRLKTVVTQIEEKSVDVNIQRHTGDTALMLASWYARTDVVEYLLSKNARVDLRNMYGNTALVLAADGNDPKSIRMLVAAGSELELKNNREHTALAHAVYNARGAAAQELISLGANIDVKDRDGVSLVGIARNIESPVLRDELVEIIRAASERRANEFLASIAQAQDKRESAEIPKGTVKYYEDMGKAVFYPLPEYRDMKGCSDGVERGDVIFNSQHLERITHATGTDVHPGVDLLLQRNTFGAPVCSPFNGVVVDPVIRFQDGKTTDKGKGNSFAIKTTLLDGRVISCSFAHMETLSDKIKPGYKLTVGDLLGTIGGTSNGKRNGVGKHLHFQCEDYKNAKRAFGKEPFLANSLLDSERVNRKHSVKNSRLFVSPQLLVADSSGLGMFPWEKPKFITGKLNHIAFEAKSFVPTSNIHILNTKINALASVERAIGLSWIADHGLVITPVGDTDLTNADYYDDKSRTMIVPGFNYGLVPLVDNIKVILVVPNQGAIKSDLIQGQRALSDVMRYAEENNQGSCLIPDLDGGAYSASEEGDYSVRRFAFTCESGNQTYVHRTLKDNPYIREIRHGDMVLLVSMMTNYH